MTMISSKNLSTKKLKELTSLSQKKYRKETGLFLVEGEKLVEEALNSDFKVLDIFRREEYGESVMKKISNLTTPPSVIALVEQKKCSAEDIEFNKGKLYFLLDGISDPGNLGTIIRTAEWFGIQAVVTSLDCAELYNPKCVQATMGALFRMNIATAPLEEIIVKLQNSGAEIFATMLDGRAINQTIRREFLEQIKGKVTAVIFGNESRGISEGISRLIEQSHRILIPQFSADGKRIEIEQFNSSESLNVAASVAVISTLFREF